MDAFAVRRFDIADLSKHGGWILSKMSKRYPHLQDTTIAGFLRGIINSPEYLFLYGEDAVALAQSVHELLVDRVVVREHFVFAKPGHEKEAVTMYEEMARWARSQGIREIYLQSQGDVPHEVIKERLGRIYHVAQPFVRV
jgi:hypothetical protein